MASADYPAVPGPADRVLFDEMQARQRRAARWYGLLGAIAVVAAGIPVSLVVTPLLFVVLLAAIRVSAIFGAVPAVALRMADEITATAHAALSAVTASEWPQLDAVTVGLLFLPGAAAMMLLWLVVRSRLNDAAAGGSVANMARAPAAGDFEEYQLQNLVGEMAIAAGAPAPQVRLLDAAVVNAAAIGARREHATIVVTRALLDRLNRDETQAVIGHLVASVANDDLAVARLLLSVQQTLGLLTTILNVPFGRQSRRTLAALLRHRSPDQQTAAADALAIAGFNTDDDLSRWMTTYVPPAVRSIRVVPVLLLFPVFFVAASARISATLVTGGLFGWVFAAIWRRRRRAADAMAVELTRNPDALARALRALVEGEHRVGGLEGAAHLFIAWQPDPSGKNPLPLVFGGVGTLAPAIEKRREALRRMGAGSVLKAVRWWAWKDLLRGPSRTLLVLFPALIVIGAAAGALVLAVMIGFNFLLLGGLLLMIDWIARLVTVV